MTIAHPIWIQRTLRLPVMRRGFHLITSPVVDQLPELADFRTGLFHLFIQHTSASLTINENADPDVRVDLESSMNAIYDALAFFFDDRGM